MQDWVERVVAKRQMTRANSEENVTLKEEEKSSGYASESKKSVAKVPVEEMGVFVPPLVECTYVADFIWDIVAPP